MGRIHREKQFLAGNEYLHQPCDDGSGAFDCGCARQAFLEYEPLYTPQGFAATTPTTEQIENRWDEGPVWVAMQDEAVVGTVAVVPKGESLYLRSMAIVQAARGQGVGRLLLEEAERFARENGFQRIFLSTTPFLDSAIRLYERFGFKRMEAGQHGLFGTPLFTMEKVLQIV